MLNIWLVCVAKWCIKDALAPSGIKYLKLGFVETTVDINEKAQAFERMVTAVEQYLFQNKTVGSKT